MISEYNARAAIDAAMSTGADFAELFLEDSSVFSMSMQKGSVENANTSRVVGTGVRILLEDRCVYAYCNGHSPKSIIETAKQAAAALSGTPGKMTKAFFVPLSTDNTPVMIVPATVSGTEKAGLLSSANSAAKSYSDRISQVKLSYGDKDKRVLIANSDGLFAGDRRVNCRVFIESVAARGTEFQTGYKSAGYAMGFEQFGSLIDVEALARGSAQKALTNLDAPECPAGCFPVVIESGGGVIFHEACGHALEATSVSVGNSVFCGKIGKKIASDKVSAVDDGTLKNAWGSENIDDEGSPTMRNVLIEKGVLKGYLIDKVGARRMNMAATGSGRRQSYRFAPTSRMSNTYILPGVDDDDEMIATMGTGLFAKSMGGGSVNPLTGEFNFGVSEGYWVENGRIMHPVRGAVLIGKGADVLMNIDRVGKNMGIAIGMCGSRSGSVPAGMGQPRIRVTAMTVGGKG